MSDNGEWLLDYPWYAPQPVPVLADDLGNTEIKLELDSIADLWEEDEE